MAARIRLPRALDPLREREFRLFFFGQSLSLIGDGVLPVALVFAVLDLTGSVSDLGLVLTARTVPLVAFVLVGGVVGDRLSRRRMMLGADVIRFASQGASAGLLIAGSAHVWELALLQAVYGTATAFFTPALAGLVPTTVSAPRLAGANALRSLAQATGRIGGPAIAGVLVAGPGPGWALAVDAGTFAASCGFLAALRLPAHERVPNPRFLQQLREGWTEFRARSWVWATVLGATFGNFLGAGFFVLGPVVAKRSLGGPGAWAAIFTALGVGSVIGGFLALRLRPARPLLVATIAVATAALPSVLLAIPAPTAAIAAGALLAGAGGFLFNALWDTALGERIPAAVLSRVSAYDWFGSFIAQPLGFALVGPVAAAVGTSTTLWIAGIAELVVCGAVLGVRDVRELAR
jgi:hypothetical protein